MANTLNLGNGNWATKKDSLLAYNSENNNYKPLPFDFTRASSATVVNKAGLIETVGSGEPRIDFSNDAKGALLLEPSRTNNLLQSNQFDTTWIDSITTNTSGYLGLDGTNSAWLLTKTASSNANIRQNITFSGTHTFSVYLKKGTLTSVGLRSTGGLDAKVEINLIDGTTSGEVNTTSVKAESVGNDWWRCSLTFEAAVNTAVRIYPDSITGTTAGDIYIWGAQLEQGSYATSYIPTSGSTVTRSQDNINTSLGTVLPLSGEVSVYIESLGQPVTGISNAGKIVSVGFNALNGGQSYVSLNFTGTEWRARVQDGSSSNFINLAVSQTEKIKIVLVLRPTTYALYANGSLIGSETRAYSGTAPVITSIAFIAYNNAISDRGITRNKDLRVYNTALSSAEAIALTAI